MSGRRAWDVTIGERNQVLTDREGVQVEHHAIAPVMTALFWLNGFVVLAADDAGSELKLLVKGVGRSGGCGEVVQAKNRRPSEYDE